MNFSFNATAFRDLFHSTVADYLKDESVVSVSMTDDVMRDKALSIAELNVEEMNSPHNLLASMDQAIDVMVRAEASWTGLTNTGKIKAGAIKTGVTKAAATKAVIHKTTVETKSSTSTQTSNINPIGVLEEKDISRIGQYALGALEGMLAFVKNKTGQQSRDLLRFSLPLSLWVARHGGRLSHIDMLVHSLAGYANEVAESGLLIELTEIYKEVIEACDDKIQSDEEQVNDMRPWRILNLNYAIVATRSHQPKLIEQAYDALVKNLPQDARDFFKEGMLQMDAVGYPDEVRTIVERYNKIWGAESMLH